MQQEFTTSQVNDEMRVVWKIKKFLKSQDLAICSRSFSYNVQTLYLRIYPTGDKWFEALTPPVLSMSLIGIRPTNTNAQIEYIMGIRKADSSEIRHAKYVSRADMGTTSTPAHELISRCNLELHKSLMVPGDTLTVFCNIRYANGGPAMNVVSSTPSTHDGVLTLIENFKDAYLGQRFTDVKIRVGNKEFLTHKVVLCARSDVFAAMFEHDMVEKRSGVVTVKDSDPESFECFLLYLYTGKLDTVSSFNAVSLYKTADVYGLKDLKKECIGYMYKKMTVDSFCDIFDLAVMHNESYLLSSATKFFIRNAHIIMSTKEWLILLGKHTTLCNELMVTFAKSGLKK